MQTRTWIGGMWALLLAGLIMDGPKTRAASPVPPTTSYSRLLLTAPDAATARTTLSLSVDAAVDSDAQAYMRRVGVTNSDDQRAINGFVSTLKAGGAWPYVVDVGFFRTNYGGSSNVTARMTTLLGRTCYVTNVIYDSFGFSFSNGVVVIPNLTNDLRTNTLIAVVKNWGGGDNGGKTQGLIGMFGNNSYEQVGYDNYGWNDLANSGASSWANGNLVIWDNNESYYAKDQKRRVVSCCFSNATMQMYYDGWPCPTESTYGPSVNVAYAPGVPLTDLWIGNNAAGTLPLVAKVEAFVVLSVANNTNAIQTVERALRWLEPSEVNTIIVADSQSVNNQYNVQGGNTSGTNSWAWMMMNASPNTGNECWWNESRSGTRILDYQNPSANHYQRLTNRLFLDGLGGPVKELKAYVYLGANDLLQGETAAQMIGYYSNVLAILNSAKAKITVISQHTIGTNAWANSVAWSDAEDANRAALNYWLASNPQLYTRYVDLDPIMNRGSMSSLAISRDGLHATFLGNSLVLRQVLGGAPETVTTVDTNGVPTFNVMPMGGLRLWSRTNAPTGYEVGAGRCVIWCSNGYSLYRTVSTDGTNATTAAW